MSCTTTYMSVCGNRGWDWMFFINSGCITTLSPLTATFQTRSLQPSSKHSCSQKDLSASDFFFLLNSFSSGDEIPSPWAINFNFGNLFSHLNPPLRSLSRNEPNPLFCHFLSKLIHNQRPLREVERCFRGNNKKINYKGVGLTQPRVWLIEIRNTER